MPAEWEPRELTLMSWPVRAETWLEGLAGANDGYSEVANAISAFERLVMVARHQPDADGRVPFAEAKQRLSSDIELWDFPHDDSWLRDNGPTFVLGASGERAGCTWRFNAWGKKYQPFDADQALAPRILERLGVRRIDAPFVLEGGSIHSDGEGTILTTRECLLNPNRNPDLTQADIEGYLRAYLDAKSFIWLDRGLYGDETDGHVDNLACFVRPGLIAMQVPRLWHDRTHDQARDNRSPALPASSRQAPDERACADNLEILATARDALGRKPEVVTIEAPPARTCRGETLTLSYINFYPVTGGLIVPVFGRDGDAESKKADDRALGILGELYPGRKMHPVDGMRIIKGGGNVHCITQQVPLPI